MSSPLFAGGAFKVREDTGGAASDIEIGVTTITGGADTQVLFNDGGFVGSDADFTYDGAGRITITGGLTVTQADSTSGTPTAMILLTDGDHTAMTASTEYIAVDFNLDGVNQFATGALTTQRAVLFRAPTYSFVGASTITNAFTLDIGQPVAGTNATITNKAALRVAGITSPGGSLAEQFGLNAVASGTAATSLGRAASATGVGSVAIGQSAATGANTSAIAIGNSSTATAANQFVAAPNNGGITNVFFGSGVVAASPIDYTINGSGGSGTNITGGVLTLAGGKGTGDAVGGAIVLSTSDTTISGTTLQSLTEKARITSLGNLCLGVTSAGSATASRTLVLGNGGTAPTASADRVQLWAEDISAGNATLAIFSEIAVATEGSTPDSTWTIRLNGANYKIPLEAL